MIDFIRYVCLNELIHLNIYFSNAISDIFPPSGNVISNLVTLLCFVFPNIMVVREI